MKCFVNRMLVFAVLAGFFLPALACGDTLRLKSGQVLKGKIVSVGDDRIEMDVYVGSDILRTDFSVSEVEQVEFARKEVEEELERERNRNYIREFISWFQSVVNRYPIVGFGTFLLVATLSVALFLTVRLRIQEFRIGRASEKAKASRFVQKRAATRIPAKGTIRFRTESGEEAGIVRVGEAQDISRTGIGFQAKERFEKRERLVFLFDHPRGGGAVEVPGDIMRVHKLKSDEVYEYGVQFVNVFRDQKAAVEEYIRQQI